MNRDVDTSERPSADSDSLVEPHLSVCAIVVAGGSGERFGDIGGKQLARAFGVPVAGHTVKAFVRSLLVDKIVVVVHPDRVEEYRQEILNALSETASATVSTSAGETDIVFVAGGDSRQLSVANGLAAADVDADVLIIHDGARPLVTPGLIDESIRTLTKDEEVDGLVVGHPSFDTLKQVDGSKVTGTPDRSAFWVAQTPQLFRAAVVRDAYRSAIEQGVVGTDDASLVEAAGGCVRMMEGPRINIKVTTAEDLDIVEAVLRLREEGVS